MAKTIKIYLIFIFIALNMSTTVGARQLSYIVQMQKPVRGENLDASPFYAPSAFLESTLANRINDLKIEELGVSGFVRIEIDDDDRQQVLALQSVSEVSVENKYRPNLAATKSRISYVAPPHPIPERQKKQIVFVLDTGVDKEHPFLNATVYKQACLSQDDPTRGIFSLCPHGVKTNSLDITDFSEFAATGCSSSIDTCGHGSHISGIISGQSIAAADHAGLSGISHSTEIYHVQIYSKYSKLADCAPQTAPCMLTNDSSIIRALNLVLSEIYAGFVAEDRDIVAVNISAGGKLFSSFCDTRSPLTAQLNAITNLGVPVFVASGNDASLLSVASPGCIESVVTVGALNENMEIWNKTNRSSDGGIIDVMAPGTNINSSWLNGEFSKQSGTSMATAVATGIYSDLKSRFPDRSTVDILNSILNNGSVVVDSLNQKSFPVISHENSLTILGSGLPVPGPNTIAAFQSLNNEATSFIVQSDRPIEDALVEKLSQSIQGNFTKLNDKNLRLNVENIQNFEFNDVKNSITNQLSNDNIKLFGESLFSSGF